MQDQSAEFEQFMRKIVTAKTTETSQLESLFAQAYKKMPRYEEQIRGLQEQMALTDLEQFVSKLQSQA